MLRVLFFLTDNVEDLEVLYLIRVVLYIVVVAVALIISFPFSFLFFIYKLDTGKLITWGSTDDLGQSYVTSGKHGVVQLSLILYVCGFLHRFPPKKLTCNFLIFSVKETPEPFPLPTEASIVKAAAGWAHCVSATGTNCLDFTLLTFSLPSVGLLG